MPSSNIERCWRVLPMLKRRAPVHCLIKMEIAAQDGRLRRGAELEQEAGDLILFLINPGPHRRISHSSIGKADERRLHELGPATDFNRVGNSELYFYAS